MDRRNFLTAGKKKKKPDPFPDRIITSGLSPYSGSWTSNEVNHLLKRTMFGATQADISHFKAMSCSQAVDELLSPVPASIPLPVKEYATSTTATTPDTTVLQGTTWVNDINNDGTVQSQRRASYKKWWAGRMIGQDRSILEKLILFWIDHFGNETADVGHGNYAYRQHMLIRQYALGNFKQMVDAITKDLHMLRYLNGYLNIASAPDENYARELLELFTIGKGPGSQYTENDVKEAAKVLTGWQVNATTWTAVFTSTRHSSANKTFSSFFGNTVITGLTGSTAGQAELTALLNMIFNTQEAARFICRKLYRFFVYYAIDANVETNIIEPLAAIFRAGNYEIKPVLAALLKSEHFYDALNQGCYIKSPADLIIGSLREMNVVFPVSSDWDTNYGMWNFFYSSMSNMGLTLHDPPNVSGTPAYYQEPLFHELWINSDTLPKRNQYTDTMVNTGFSRNGQRVQFNLVAYVQQFSNPGNPSDLIDDALNHIFRNALSFETKKTIKTQILLSNQQWDYYWTNAWMAYISSPTTANFNIVNTRLKSLFQYFFNLAEYQLS